MNNERKRREILYLNSIEFFNTFISKQLIHQIIWETDSKGKINITKDLI